MYVYVGGLVDICNIATMQAKRCRVEGVMQMTKIK